MVTTACINEIFSSPQGEGLYAGEKMTFIRFASCTLGCQWCDTDCNPNKFCRVYISSQQTPDISIQNPVGIAKLNEIMGEFPDGTVGVTGGEPLEQVGFLKEYLPILSGRRKILLETNGIHFNALKEIAKYTDIISMDIKLPSSTGKRPLWKEHEQFLHAALETNAELYVKLVVTSSTSDRDINEAIKLLSKTNRYVPIFIQPVTPSEGFPDAISSDRILSLKRLLGAWLPNVRVSQQMHRMWGVK